MLRRTIARLIAGGDMPDFTVHEYGTDVYGRPVLMTVFMHEWYEAWCAQLGFRPAVAQGCYMSRLGGGASASEGAHDLGKCVDYRTSDRTEAEIDLMVEAARNRGGAAYRRDRSGRHGGMTPHMHITVNADAPGSPMANILWGSYLAGGDGLAGPYDDYEWRPNPLVLTPPEEDMPLNDADLKKISDLFDARLDLFIATPKVDVNGKKWSLITLWKSTWTKAKA